MNQELLLNSFIVLNVRNFITEIKDYVSIGLIDKSTGDSLVNKLLDTNCVQDDEAISKLNILRERYYA